MSLVALRNAGAAELLNKAAEIIQDRGIARGVVHNFKTGEVDAFGALCIAAGAKPKHLTIDDVEMCKVPLVRQGAVVACVETVEAYVGDITTWSDRSTPQEVATQFNEIADRILIAVT